MVDLVILNGNMIGKVKFVEEGRFGHSWFRLGYVSVWLI